MTRKILGLDLRDHSISAVVVTHGRRGIRIEAHANAPVAVSEGDPNGLAQALGVLLDGIDPAGCICAVSIPPGLVSFRNLRIPFDQPKKIRQVLPYEIEPALPYPVEDVSIGFQVLELTGEPAGTGTELTLAAVENHRLQTYLDALSDAGVRPDSVTVGGFAAARWIAAGQAESDLLLVDADGPCCAVFALSHGEVVMGRAFSTGRPGPVSENALCTRICQTVHAMEDTLPWGFSPRAGFIIGAEPPGGAVLSGQALAPALSRELGIPFDPTDLGGGADTPAITWNAGRMDNALALALAESGGLGLLDFRSGHLGLKKLWVENRPSVIRTSLLAAAVLVLALVSALAGDYTKQKHLDGLNRQITAVFSETFPEVRTVVDPLQQMRATIRQVRQEAGLSQGANRMRAVDILRELSVRIPRGTDVDLGQIVIGPEGVRMSGSTDGFDSVDRIKNGLSTAAGFSSVDITSATVEKSGKRVRFKLKMTPSELL